MEVRLSQKGWVVIPADLRAKYGLKPGRRLQVVDYGGVLALVPLADDPVAAAAGLLQGGPSMTAALLDEHRQERQRDR